MQLRAFFVIKEKECSFQNPVSQHFILILGILCGSVALPDCFCWILILFSTIKLILSIYSLYSSLLLSSSLSLHGHLIMIILKVSTSRYLFPLFCLLLKMIFSFSLSHQLSYLCVLNLLSPLEPVRNKRNRISK